jgi:hypothetical protein
MASATTNNKEKNVYDEKSLELFQFVFLTWKRIFLMEITRLKLVLVISHLTTFFLHDFV